MIHAGNNKLKCQGWLCGYQVSDLATTWEKNDILHGGKLNWVFQVSEPFSLLLLQFFICACISSAWTLLNVAQVHVAPVRCEEGGKNEATAGSQNKRKGNMGLFVHRNHNAY